MVLDEDSAFFETGIGLGIGNCCRTYKMFGTNTFRNRGPSESWPGIIISLLYRIIHASRDYYIIRLKIKSVRFGFDIRKDTSFSVKMIMFVYIMMGVVA